MFERLTTKAAGVFGSCQKEARRYGHDSIGTGHLLLALTSQGSGASRLALAGLGVDFDQMREDVLAAIGDPGGHAGGLPFTRSAKKVFDLAAREADDEGAQDVNTEHFLLAMLREGEGTGAEILALHGITHAAVREQVDRLLAASTHPAGRPLACFLRGGQPYSSRQAADAAGPGDVVERTVELQPEEAFVVSGVGSARLFLDLGDALRFAEGTPNGEVFVASPTERHVWAEDSMGRRVVIGCERVWERTSLAQRITPDLALPAVSGS